MIGFIKPEDTPERDAVLDFINNDDDGSGAAATVLVPAPAGAADGVAGVKADG